jgi:hypothetical protein
VQRCLLEIHALKIEYMTTHAYRQTEFIISIVECEEAAITIQYAVLSLASPAKIRPKKTLLQLERVETTRWIPVQRISVVQGPTLGVRISAGAAVYLH